MDPAGLLASNPKHRTEGLEGSQCPVREAGRLRVGLHFSQGTGATQAGTPFPKGRFKIADTSASLTSSEISIQDPTDANDVSVLQPFIQNLVM